MNAIKTAYGTHGAEKGFLHPNELLVFAQSLADLTPAYAAMAHPPSMELIKNQRRLDTSNSKDFECESPSRPPHCGNDFGAKYHEDT